MRKRLLIFAGLLTFVVVLCLFSVWHVISMPGITPRNVEAITPGMSVAEVQALLGGPPGIHDPTVSVQPIPATAPSGKHWIGRRAAVYVCFDDSGRVIEVY